MDYLPTIPLLRPPPAAGGNWYISEHNDGCLPSTTPTTCDALDGKGTIGLNTEKKWDAIWIYYSIHSPTATRTTNNRDIT